MNICILDCSIQLYYKVKSHKQSLFQIKKTTNGKIAFPECLNDQCGNRDLQVSIDILAISPSSLFFILFSNFISQNLSHSQMAIAQFLHLPQLSKRQYHDLSNHKSDINQRICKGSHLSLDSAQETSILSSEARRGKHGVRSPVTLTAGWTRTRRDEMQHQIEELLVQV